MKGLDQIDTSTAQVPSTYSAAKRAISQCLSIDECKDWTDKAAALATYAMQAKDSKLEQMAKRIRARATRRAGELLKQIEPATGAHLKRGGAPPLSRKRAAADAGLSADQAKTALRLASVPEGEFESMVEGNATVTEIERVGTKRKKAGRSAPEAFEDTRIDGECPAHARGLMNAATAYLGFFVRMDIKAAVSALSDDERDQLRGVISRLDRLHDEIMTSM